MLRRITHLFSVSLHWESTTVGRCPQCETENDPSFTYCRNCTRSLTE